LIIIIRISTCLVDHGGYSIEDAAEKLKGKQV